MQKIIYGAKFKARLRLIKSNEQKSYNWLFLPGGPGLGSESLYLLVNNLDLPGTMWYLDFPGDGSNLTDDDDYYFAHWKDALAEAVEMLDSVILVAHSTGAMYALAAKELKELLYGLVIMDSAPDASWQKGFADYVDKNPLPNMEYLQELYAKFPHNENLKHLVIASLPYLFTSQGLQNEKWARREMPTR